MRRVMSHKDIYLGTANFGTPYGVANDVVMTNQEVEEVLTWSCGKIKILDYAPEYYGAKDQLVNFSKNFEISTKVNFQDFSSASALESHIEQQMLDLEVARFKGVLVRYAPDPSPRSKILWDALCDLKKNGIVQSIGFSIYSPSEFLSAVREYAGVDMFQVPESIVNRHFSDFLSTHANFTKEFKFIVRSIFLQGLLLMELHRVPKHLKLMIPTIRAIQQEASRQSISLLELLIGYTQSLSWSTGTVIGVNSCDQLKIVYEAIDRGQQVDLGFLRDMPIPPNGLLDPRTWKSN